MAADLLRVFAIGSPVIYKPFGQDESFAATIIAMTVFESKRTEQVEYSVHLEHSNTVTAAWASELTATDYTIYSRIFTP